MQPVFLQKYECEAEEPGTFTMTARFVVGSTGAIGAFSRASQFFNTAAFTRVSAGKYKCPLTTFFYQQPALPGGVVPSPLVDCSAKVIGAYLATTGHGEAKVVVDNMLNADSTGVPYVTIEFVEADTGVAADVASGNEVNIRLTMKAHP
jgi:hypothetical protein